ncbi:MAG: hypothetical protein LLG06_12300 [Desulfobacteraceae bacterium]|nr:hypothetical protein [Desulfobacteraceae bacterium]
MNNAICPHSCKDCFAMRTCAVGAISEVREGIVIDASQCIGCGCCKTACSAFGYKALQHKSMKRMMGAV